MRVVRPTESEPPSSDELVHLVTDDELILDPYEVTGDELTPDTNAATWLRSTPPPLPPLED